MLFSPVAVALLATLAPLAASAFTTADYNNLTAERDVPLPYKGLAYNGFTVLKGVPQLTPSSGHKYIAFSQGDYALISIYNGGGSGTPGFPLESVYLGCVSDFSVGVTKAANCTIDVVMSVGRGGNPYGPVHAKRIHYTTVGTATEQKMKKYSLVGLTGDIVQFLLVRGQTATSIFLDDLVYSLP